MEGWIGCSKKRQREQTNSGSRIAKDGLMKLEANVVTTGSSG